MSIEELIRFLENAPKKAALEEYGVAYGAASDGAPINVMPLRQILIKRFGEIIIPEIDEEEEENYVGAL